MNVAAILAIGLPTLSVLVGILLNHSDTNRLDARISNETAALRASVTAEIGTLRTAVTAELNSLRASVASDVTLLRADIRGLHADIATIRNDQREFYRSIGEHEVRLDNLEKK